MPGQTIGTVNVQMGSTQQVVSTLSYGTTTLKGMSDVSMAGAQDRDVVTYVASTNSFVIAPAENSRLIIDNGFF
jgi:hypothetical protein